MEGGKRRSESSARWCHVALYQAEVVSCNGPAILLLGVLEIQQLAQYVDYTIFQLPLFVSCCKLHIVRK